MLAILLSDADGFTHIRCVSNLSPADFKDDVAALEPVLRGKAVRVDLSYDHSFGAAAGVNSRVLQVQYHGITDAANLETWRGMSYQTVLTPADQKTGDLIYPYDKAK